MNPDAYLWITQITNLTICNVTLDGNSSQVVGYNPMLYVDGTLNLNNSVVQNHVNTSFGAIQVTDCGTFNATATVFQNNSAVKGGHIENDGMTYLNGRSLQNGSAQEMGGAIYNGKSLTIENSKITGNQAGKLGGAIYNRDVLSISQSVIYSNTGTCSEENGDSDGVPEIEAYMKKVLPDPEAEKRFRQELLEIVPDVLDFLPGTE